MKKINNKGFTLIEVLAVVAIIAILGIISVPNILKTINTGKEKSYEILIKDIKVAGQQLYEEIENVGSTIHYYNNCGIDQENEKVNITGNKITINLQTLLSNGFLSGINQDTEKTEECVEDSDKNENNKIILNPKNDKDMGKCKITITKIKTSNNVEYKIKSESGNPDYCPKTEDFNS